MQRDLCINLLLYGHQKINATTCYTNSNVALSSGVHEIKLNLTSIEGTINKLIIARHVKEVNLIGFFTVALMFTRDTLFTI